MAEWDVVSHEPDPWAVVAGGAKDPQVGDPVPTAGAPKGFYAVTGDDGKKTLRRDLNASDIIHFLSDLPGVGMAERIGQGATRLAGKAASGVAGIFGADPTAIQNKVNAATELPPSNDPVVQGVGALQHGAEAVAAPVDRMVGNLPPGPRTAIEGVEEAIPDVAGVLGAAPQTVATRAGLIPKAAPAIARAPAEVGSAAGYTGLRTKADLAAPGNQAITDALIARDAGIVPGQPPSVTALENARRVGPGRVYRAVEDRIPAQLTQDEPLQASLSNLPQQVSQLPRSPDVDALQETMLSQPQMTRDELFANIREARERAKSHWKSDDPDKAALGDAYAHLANAYEDFVGRQLAQSGDETTLADWQQARTQMAKNYQAQGALRGEHFNAQVYGTTAQQNPHLLTGNAAIVGHVANGLPSSGLVGMADIGPAAGGALAGEALGQHAGVPGVGAMAGAIGAPLVRAKLQQLLTRGRPDLAAQTTTNPALSYFFPQGHMPQGWNRAPVTPQIAGLLPSPSMVNAGGGASTSNTLENLGLTPDVQAAGAQHPAAARLQALREQLTQAPERPAEPVDFQGPQKWGDFAVAPQAAAVAPQPGGIPFENVLEQGGTQRPPVGAPGVAYRPPSKSPNQNAMRTPPGAPELTEQPPQGPSDAQMAFRNKLAAQRLRKIAGDLRLEGPGSATGSPIDRLREALVRRERGYADGGGVRNSSSPGSPGVGGAVHDALAALKDYFIDRPRRELQASREQFENSVIDNGSPTQSSSPAREEYAGGGRVELAEKLAAFLERITTSKAAQDAEVGARFPDRPRPPLVQLPEDSLVNAAMAPPESIALPPTQTSPLQLGFLTRRQGMADGGTVDDTHSSLRRLADAARALDNPAGTDSNAENRARVATNLASLFYGLDAQGNPALGGRAWTQSQGGTPMGTLDALTATPHNLVQLGSLIDHYLPGKSNPQFWASIDPTWSRQAAERLSQLRQRVQQTANVAPAKSFTDTVLDTVTDPAMIAPMGAAGVAAKGTAGRRLLNAATGASDVPQGAP